MTKSVRLRAVDIAECAIFVVLMVAGLTAFLADYIVGIPYCIIAAKLLGVENLTNLLVVGNLVYMPKDAC